MLQDLQGVLAAIKRYVGDKSGVASLVGAGNARW
jgi:hypothetical protein